MQECRNLDIDEASKDECIYFPPLLAANVIGATDSCSCHCDFLEVMGHNLKLSAKINPLSPKLLLVRMFYHRHRNETRTIGMIRLVVWSQAHSQER